MKTEDVYEYFSKDRNFLILAIIELNQKIMISKVFVKMND